MEENSKEQQNRMVNLEFALRSGRGGEIEFWQDNGNGTCTRVADGLTLTYELYEELPARRRLTLRRYQGRLRWDA